MKTRHAAVKIIDGNNNPVRIDVTIEGITPHNARKIFEQISDACVIHMQSGARLESIYFYEEVIT